MERVWLRPPITAMPLTLYGVLQAARSSLLRFATPFDAAFRKARNLEPLPPLWLRRHVGAVRNFESAARQTADLIRELDLVRPDDQVLDIGCGTGVMAFELARVLGPAGRYLGFDVDREAVEWCRAAFARDLRFSFELADVASPYGRTSLRSAGLYRFPIADQEAGFVLAKSVFTHLLEGDARSYLSEIRRVLRPGRTAVVTTFLFAKGSLTGRGQSPVFSFGESRGLVRWRWRARPESAVAYEREYFMDMVSDARLRLQWFCQGFWPGDATCFTGQDVLFLGH